MENVDTERVQAIVQARCRKAVKLAHAVSLATALYDRDVSVKCSEVARTMSAEGRRAAERRARVRESSDATWELVVLILEGGESW